MEDNIKIEISLLGDELCWVEYNIYTYTNMYILINILFIEKKSIFCRFGINLDCKILQSSLIKINNVTYDISIGHSLSN